MSKYQPIFTGDDLIQRLCHQHAIARECPHCAESVGRIALVNLVYSFATCNCDEYPYQHLVEQVWHKACFLQAAGGESA